MKDSIEHKKKRIGGELRQVVEDAQDLARQLGLDPRPVHYWVVDNDEMNELAAYGGFQERYPHWRWGMKYDKQSKRDQYIGGRIFELVINDNPCHAYLQMNNNMADQKSVITHVEAHSDFFENNQWFQDEVDAADMMARNSERIGEYMEDPDIGRGEIERWIDHALCLEDNINQYSEFIFRSGEGEVDGGSEDNPLDNLEVSGEIKDDVFGDWEPEKDSPPGLVNQTHSDVLGYLIENGKQFDEGRGEAVDFDDWQIDILDMIREESYYIAPQKMTKIMNEGWASYWESLMMTDEGFADTVDIIDYSDQTSRVLGGDSFNPYRLGKALWEHIENTVNRREVVDKILRVEGITPKNFHKDIDFQKVHEALDERGSYVPEKRLYSLCRPRNQGFIQDISRGELKKMKRYIIETERYGSVEEAISDVDHGCGWNRMMEIRETHNDVMFIDEFLTQEFVDGEEYFTYEYRASQNEMQIASRDVEDVRKKLLLNYTNFGKPTIEVGSGNFQNSGELLLIHRYNGVVLDLKKATSVMERVYEMWGRPVNIATVGKQVSELDMENARMGGGEPEAQELPIRFRYDGVDFTEHELEEEIEEEIQAKDIDYSTKPEEWL